MEPVSLIAIVTGALAALFEQPPEIHDDDKKWAEFLAQWQPSIEYLLDVERTAYPVYLTSMNIDEPSCWSNAPEALAVLWNRVNGKKSTTESISLIIDFGPSNKQLGAMIEIHSSYLTFHVRGEQLPLEWYLDEVLSRESSPDKYDRVKYWAEELRIISEDHFPITPAKHWFNFFRDRLTYLDNEDQTFDDMMTNMYVALEDVTAKIVDNNMDIIRQIEYLCSDYDKNRDFHEFPD